MNQIKHLAELVGFHQSYVDCFGRYIPANEEAEYALLTAMGYKLDNEQLLKQSINYLEQREWLNILPSAHIAKLEESVHQVSISLPADSCDDISYNIQLEKGENTSGVTKLSQLKQVAVKELNNKQYIKYLLQLPELEMGYHILTIEVGEYKDSCPLIFAPKTCYSPQEASKEKIWGYAAQLYSLTSENNWGMGDFGDLLSLVELSAKQEASVIGLNPLHPLYQNNPAHRSPYSPTSRCFLNTLYIDVKQIPNYQTCETAQLLVNSHEFKNKVNYARNCELIDYTAVSDIKFSVIEILYQDFIKNNNCALTEEFLEFKAQGGDDLKRLATFEALYEHFRKIDEHAFGWSAWPEAYQQPSNAAVMEFQQLNAERINYFTYVQWLAHRQLKNVADTAKERGMPIGLYMDLAVGCDGSGVDIWSDKEMYVPGAAVGAPPDAMNVLGQDWGLTPINPVALQEQGYLPLAKALRSNMQYAGALRIDHILGLMRQYWVAPGMAADQGVYITFPFDDILRIIALESRRNNCVVIGEDLGTVPEGFSEIMEAAGLLSYKVLFFERWESGYYKRPELYPAQSMVTISTHDLPTMAGWWTGRDLAWRQQLNLYPNEEMGIADRKSRIDDRGLLLAALQDLGVIDNNNLPDQSPAKMNKELGLAVQKFLAQAPSHVQLIPLEDALEIHEQVNIPGTIDEHPNWKQKLPVTLEEFSHVDSVTSLVSAMQIARPKTI
ncbi:4-alpha-glucanotransferase [Thalassotalea profundi]|uniref:4-alpha-glucanotransferase n=1 Tax=Thalassotalea profundi TaxID=2036687 RepID=A0ABQ3IHC2_9GAMM|nr:4-alpha-glucanotransferase [Thalassotalea profundi]GHE78069.1 4-alpha-glucanotransferase [Thalassotalea profundi]